MNIITSVPFCYTQCLVVNYKVQETKKVREKNILERQNNQQNKEYMENVSSEREIIFLKSQMKGLLGGSVG